MPEPIQDAYTQQEIVCVCVCVCVCLYMCVCVCQFSSDIQMSPGLRSVCRESEALPDGARIDDDVRSLFESSASPSGSGGKLRL